MKGEAELYAGNSKLKEKDLVQKALQKIRNLRPHQISLDQVIAQIKTTEAQLKLDESVMGTSTGGRAVPGRTLRSHSKTSENTPRKHTQGKEQERRGSQHSSSSEEDVGAVESQAESGSESSDGTTLSPGQMNQLTKEELVQLITRLRKKEGRSYSKGKGQTPQADCQVTF